VCGREFQLGGYRDTAPNALKGLVLMRSCRACGGAKRIGGRYEKAPDWESFAIVDDRLVTGQNPASSTAAAQALLTLVMQNAS
jgi:putative intracellular protease/amidase